MRRHRVGFLVAGALLAGCGGGDGSSQSAAAPPVVAPSPVAPAAVKVDGAVQKGPFIVGSTVLINLLDDRGQSTPSTIVSKIDDSVGSFSFSTAERGAVQLVASGYYFSELTGQISFAPITLRGVYEITDQSAQRAHVNILTHLINDRVLKLFSAGNVKLADAIAQSEKELLDAFSPALPESGIGTFSGLSIYETNGQSSQGDAYLLALSTAFYKYASDKAKEFGTATDAELTLILNQLAVDLQDDGKIKDTAFMPDFIRAVRGLSPQTIIDNLHSRSLVDYPKGLGVPDISVYLSLCAGELACPWRAGAALPLEGRAVVAYGSKVYLMAAAQSDYPNSFAVFNRRTFVYDPPRNEWTELASMPIDGFNAVAEVIGDKIYVFTGWQNKLFEYAPATNQWRELATRPSFTKYGYTSAVVNGKLYIIGGTGGTQPDPVPDGDFLPRDNVDIYDPALDAWSKGHPAPTPLETWSDSCVFGGEIYVFGGIPSLGSMPEKFVWTYNPVQDSWSAKSPMTSPRQQVTCVEVGEDFYLLGGILGRETGTPVDTVERYSPLRQTWSSPTRLPTPRLGGGAVAIEHEIVVVGGATEQPDFVEILDTDVL
jgi:N-acetylneuraminic acid mutarotase